MDRRALLVLTTLLVVVGGVGIWSLRGSDIDAPHSANDSVSAAEGAVDAALEPAVTKRERVRASPSAQVAEESLGGTVTFLELPGRRPATLDGWRMRCEGSDWSSVRTGSGGTIALRCARWEFEPCEPYDTSRLSVDLRSDPHQVVWVRTVSDLEVRVASRADASPLTGAVVQHAPYPEVVADLLSRAIAPESWSKPMATDPSGSAHLTRLLPPCLVRVSAQGYEPALVEIDGDTSAIQVALDPESASGLAVMVVESASGTPIPFVSVRAWCGAITAEAVPEGGMELKVPRALSPADRLVFTAEGYVSASVPLHRLSDAGNLVPKVVMHRTCILEVDAGSGREVEWSVRLRAEPEDGDASDAYERSLSVATESVVQAVPVGVTLEVFARSSHGASSTSMIRTQPGVNRVELRPGGSTLRILVQTDAGPGTAGDAPAARAVARVKVRDMPPFEVAEMDGALCIPFAERVSYIQVRTPGFETVRLRRVADDNARAEGVLALRLQRTWPVSLAIQDGEGRRQVGLRVVVIGRAPERERSSPSPHPAWVVQHQPPQPCVTDGTGTAILHLTDGEYQGAVSLPGSVLGSSHGNFYGMQFVAFHVQAACAREVVVDPPRRLLVRAIDALTRLPLASCRIQIGNRADLALVSGAHRTIWIPQSCASLQVDAPGYATAVVRVPDDKAELEVPMYPGGTGTLAIESANANELTGARLVLRCREPDGHRLSVRVALSNSVSIPVHIPGESCEVAIDDLEWNGAHWRFEPIQPSWHAGGHLVFRAVKGSARD